MNARQTRSNSSCPSYTISSSRLPSWILFAPSTRQSNGSMTRRFILFVNMDARRSNARIAIMPTTSTISTRNEKDSRMASFPISFEISHTSPSIFSYPISSNVLSNLSSHAPITAVPIRSSVTIDRNKNSILERNNFFFNGIASHLLVVLISFLHHSIFLSSMHCRSADFTLRFSFYFFLTHMCFVFFLLSS